MVYEQLCGTPQNSMVYDLFEGFWLTHINSLSCTMILIIHCFVQPGIIMKHPRHGWGMTLVLFSGAINSWFPAIPTTTISWILYPYIYILYTYIFPYQYLHISNHVSISHHIYINISPIRIRSKFTSLEHQPSFSQYVHIPIIYIIIHIHV